MAGRQAWSLKTVKNTSPFTSKTIRLISGRCSPDYSYGITDPHKDIQQTGRAVLGIWNERINIAQDQYTDVRTMILVRSNDLKQFVLFEEENHRFATNDYVWEVNANGNLIGIDKRTKEHRFTWQPHGSQFTIHTAVPAHCVRFELKHPERITPEGVLANLCFDETWVSFVEPTW